MALCHHLCFVRWQVSSLVWNKWQREILSSHGFSSFSMKLWQYPSLCQLAEFRGNSSRVLNLAQVNRQTGEQAAEAPQPASSSAHSPLSCPAEPGWVQRGVSGRRRDSAVLESIRLTRALRAGKQGQAADEPIRQATRRSDTVTSSQQS